MPGHDWSDELASGSRHVDAPNESLFYMLGHLFLPGVECKRRAGFCPHDGCGKVAAVVRYLSRNFAQQDKLMAESGYPDTESHARAHAELLERLRTLSDNGACGDWDEEAVSSAISGWALEHVRHHDKPLGSWLTVMQAAAMPRGQASAMAHHG